MGFTVSPLSPGGYVLAPQAGPSPWRCGWGVGEGVPLVSEAPPPPAEPQEPVVAAELSSALVLVVVVTIVLSGPLSSVLWVVPLGASLTSSMLTSAGAAVPPQSSRGLCGRPSLELSPRGCWCL